MQRQQREKVLSGEATTVVKDTTQATESVRVLRVTLIRR
jgi:hypothetical protein